MTDAVAHRGPDDSGLEIFGASGDRLNVGEGHGTCWIVGLGHRRLSILDLTSGGHQPMQYRSRFWLTYNGEIYNFLELRRELSALGHSFGSTSDSEVILAAFAEWGPACFGRFRGMWALVIVDTVTRRAILSRDRLGMKPLYVWRRDGLVAIGSEIKQFLCIPRFRRAMNVENCGLYLLTGYQEPLGAMFDEVSQLAPGCWQTVDIQSLTMESPQSYWNPERLQPTIRNQKESSQLFVESLMVSVKLHLRSDVAVGCALSGGLDSSSVAVLVDKLTGKTGGVLNTFSAVFPNYTRNERVFIDEVLRNINAQPFFVTPSPSAFLEDLNRFIWIQDEPPGSCAQYAAYCVARLAKQNKVSVALNGQGGDEVLGGYWQLYLVHLVNLLRQGRLGSLSWNIVSSCLPGGNPDLVGQIPIMWRRYRARSASLVPLKLRGVNADAILGASKLRRYLQLDAQRQRISQIRDMFLPQLLKWDDHNFMAFSVEGRYPFLDHELIELCLQFHPDLLYSHGWTKCPLRSGLDLVLPKKIVKRRSKWGFEVPQDAWLCGPLRQEIEHWLEADRPVWSWVEREDGERLARQVWASNGRVPELGQMLFRLFVLDRWLEHFSMSVD